MTAATRRSPRRRRLLGALALTSILAVFVVVLLARGSSDDPELKVINGAASAGFPLRGDLARDSGAIRAAAEGWLADDAREDEANQVLDHDEDVEMRALWAGRLHGSTVVILTGDRHAALMELGSREFHAKGVRAIRDTDQPAVLAFDQAVLVDTKADATFMIAEARENNVAPLDGLWTTTGEHAGSGLPDGGLVLRGGLRRLGIDGDRTGPAVVVTANRSSTWLIDAALEAKLVPGADTFSPEAYQRFVAATSPGSVGDGRQWNPLFDPPDVRLVEDRTLPILGPTMILTASSRTGRDEVLAGQGGSPLANGPEAESLRLTDGGNDGDGARGKDGPPLAAALFYPEQGDEPRGPALLVAGNSQIATIEVLIGRRRLTRPGPVAVIELPLSTRDTLGDFAVVGRTRAGTVVVPRQVAGG